MDKLIINWTFNIYWELSHPTRPFVLADAIQNSIRIFGNQWFTALPIWIFTICGQLLVVYFEQLGTHLKEITKQERQTSENQFGPQQTFVILRSLEQLYSATAFLHRRFQLMLVTNCCLNFVILLTSTYYAIDVIVSGLVIVRFWDAADVLDSFVRFLSICHISDQIRTAVSQVTYLKQNP